MHDAGNPADHELMARIAEGDRSALGLLAGRYERALLGLAFGLLGSRELAEEAVQDAWIRVLRGATGFREGESVKTWVYRIVINRSRDIARRERVMRARLNGKAQEAGGATGAEAGWRLRAESGADAELRAAVRRAVDELSVVEREAVLLCHHAGVTQTQAAEILQTPLGTLKSRVRAAMRRLERSLRSEVEA